MIILQKLIWDNAFSYANNNKITLDSEPLIQIIGDNGAGKTSIVMLLQEVLYGKNSKSIKKTEISNNNTNIDGYNITLEFKADSDNYVIHLNRKSTIKLKLLKNGKDISSHTSTDTYKTISSIIGIKDFKVFSQLIYQSSNSSLEFLTATDTNRKKFLINLLKLEKYLTIHNHFKEIFKSTNISTNNLQGSINTLNSWIKEHNKKDLTLLEKLPSITMDDTLGAELVTLSNNLQNIKSINLKIANNNEFKRLLSEIDYDLLTLNIDKVEEEEITWTNQSIGELQGINDNCQKIIKQLDKISGTCPSCLQTIDENTKTELMSLNKAIAEESLSNINILKNDLKKLYKIIGLYDDKQKANRDFISLQNSIDKTLASKTIDKHETQNKINNLNNQIQTIQKRIDETNRKNQQISAYNSEVTYIKNQLITFNEQLIEHSNNLKELNEYLNNIDILRKTFSTNGLVSYKLESSVKGLEKLINKYLSELSYFQVYFKLNKDKLNIEVRDESNLIRSIESISSGELALINIATVLAIRNIMSNLAGTKINFLFLDEIVGVIDTAGREKLVQVLMKENLNTFIVTHSGPIHPLVPKRYIIKTNKISKIEEE